MGQAVRWKVVLSIQDTSEITLYNPKNRIKKDDGTIGMTNAAKNGLGFFINPSLVVDASSCYPYRYCNIALWSRSLERAVKEKSDKHKHKKAPIEEKESYKWRVSSKAAKEVLKHAQMVIIV